MAGVAGSETYYINLLPELARRGVSVEFVCVEHPEEAAKNDAFREELKRHGVVCHTFQAHHQIPLAVLWKLRGLIAQRGFDVVQTNLIHADLWGALIKIMRLGRLTLVSAKHGYAEDYQTAHGFDPTHLKPDRFSLITWFAGLFADRIICISDGLKKLLIDGGLVKAPKTITIPYGFDFAGAPHLVDPGGARYGDPQIVVVARLVPVKQHHLLIDCLPRLSERFPALKVLMIGDGALKDGLKEQARRLGVSERVEWLGFQRNVHDYIRDSDFLVLPSAAEGFGLVVLEAWFNHKPVVAFDVPALNEIIENGLNGFLVPPFDQTAFEGSMERLLADPQLAKTMGEAGFDTYGASYSIDTMVDKTLKLYRDLVVQC